MRYVRARTPHVCVHCKELIIEGDVCVQSQSFGNLFYHSKFSTTNEDCFTDRFHKNGLSIFHIPIVPRTVREYLMIHPEIKRMKKDFPDKAQEGYPKKNQCD